MRKKINAWLLRRRFLWRLIITDDSVYDVVFYRYHHVLLDYYVVFNNVDRGLDAAIAKILEMEE